MIRRTFVLMAALFLAGQVEGQVPDRIVSGVVSDSLSGEPVATATIYIQGRRDEFTTDSYGRFRIPGVHTGDTLLVIRRIGYVPARVAVPTAVTGLAVDLGAVRMRAVATRLDQIAVEVEEVNRYPQLADFYRRKQANRPGVFITREDIARTASRNTSDMLRRNNKLDMDCAQQALGDKCIARSRRGRQVVQMFSNAARGQRQPNGNFSAPTQDTVEITPSMERCEMEVWVDGLRSQLTVDEVPLSWIAGIEVYTGLAQTPAQFGHGACGVVAIWTTRAST